MGKVLSELETAIRAAGLIYELFDGRSAVAVTDREKYLVMYESNFFKLGIKPGDPVKKGSFADATLTAGKRVTVRKDAQESVYGVAYAGGGIPIYHEGSIVGTMVFTTPAREQEELRKLSTQFRVSFSQVVSTSEEIARSATTLSTDMQDFSKITDQVTEISGVIHTAISAVSEVANESHLLGINAAIEAAHAREHSRGFGVVASEIRKLAESSKQNAARMMNQMEVISDLISTIVQRSNELSMLSQGLTAASEEITATMASLLDSVKHIDQLAASDIM